MPILLKSYDWRQTEDLIIIRIPMKGVSLKKADIFTSDTYLKIHSPPFLFEILLWQPVVEAKSICTVGDGEAVFRLVKHSPETWPQLSANIGREEALEQKKKVIQEAHERAEKKKKENLERKDKRQKAAVREQIHLQTEEQELIKDTKEKVKEEALVQLGWQRPQQSIKIKEVVEEEVKTLQYEKKDKIKPIEETDKDIFKPSTKSSSSRDSLTPKPREAGIISVAFTPRVFPTPCRESKLAEEQEWLEKQAEARRKTGFVAEDLRPEEKDPLWLCDKAQSFFSMGNYLGAVSAYTHAISLNCHLFELYAGRAQAQLALGNFNRVITDTSKALDLLTPPVPQNAEARARCMLYRAKALAEVKLRPEALGELRVASSLMPKCTEIQTTMETIQRMMEEENETSEDEKNVSICI